MPIKIKKAKYEKLINQKPNYINIIKKYINTKDNSPLLNNEF